MTWVPPLKANLARATEDYFWGRHLYETGRFQAGCHCLLDAYVFICYCISGDDSHERTEYQSFRQRVAEAAHSTNSRKGAEEKQKPFDAFEAVVVEFLRAHKPEGGWRTKDSAADAILGHVGDYDKQRNSEKWDSDKGERSETLRNRLIRLFSGKLKREFN